MKQFTFFSTIITLIFLHHTSTLVSQEVRKIPHFPTGKQINLSPLSSADSAALASLPVLKAESGVLKSGLPPVHDNAGQPYFRPLFEQVASECGQYASIAFNFTYEINFVRKTPANIPENQYPTHYTYNFMNGGFGWHGVSYFHSFEVAKTCGHPTVEDFGYMNSCGPSYWMSGYEKYKRGMANKIEDVYQIPVDTPEGLMVLKNWLHNHLTNDEVGGIACFYSSTPWNLNILPSGTPEGGKHVITEFLTPASHSCTITGYNDSIRFDYNGDGQYTNDIDINDDGIVDMHDWELGGLRFTDSYIDGVNWADSGFCYLMYKTLADRFGKGGIWNNAVHVVKIKEDYEPLVSMKVTIEHNCRYTLKIMAGVSESVSSAFPEHVIGFPIFDYQGGCQNMQGGYEPEAKTLELGLDITPLLGRIRSGQEASFYLLVNEHDPNHYGTGKIVSYSIIDHMNNDQEYICPENNVALGDNALTSLLVNANLVFDELLINTEQLPLALTGEGYSHQMEASGGTPPYTWNLVRGFSETSEAAALPQVDEEKLLYPDTIHSQALKVLDFEFPFYGNSFDSIWVHSEGFVTFDRQDYPWPYLYDENLMIRKIRNISPCLNNFLFIASSQENGTWYEGDEHRATFRWKMTASSPAGKEFEFALELNDTGEIVFYYDDEVLVQDQSWAAGVSNGDGINYQMPVYSSAKQLQGSRSTHFVPVPYPFDITLSEEGLLSGIPKQNYPGIDLVFDITDAMLLNRRKTLEFHSYTAGIDDMLVIPEQSVTIWPNPVKNHVHLEFDLRERTPLTFILTDPVGRIIYQAGPDICPPGKNRRSIRLDPAFIAPGVYHLLISQGDHVLHAEKIIMLN